MPFYQGSTRVNLYSASTLYQPNDSDGATCNTSGSGTATNFYAGGTRIYIGSSGSWHTIWSGSQTMRSEGSTTITANVAANTSWTYRITGTTLGLEPQEQTGIESVGNASVSWSGIEDVSAIWNVTLKVTSNGTTSMTLQRTDRNIGGALAPFVALTKVEAFY